MNTVFSLLLTPLGRYAVMGAIIMLTLTGIYYKIRRDAVAEIQAAATEDILRRTRNAVHASDALDLTPDRVRDADPNKRD
jgi:hypothetical protein